MFSTIDNKLIYIFQWMVRQFELFTSTTRKSLINSNLFLLKILTFSFFATATIKTLTVLVSLPSIAELTVAVLGLVIATIYFYFFCADHTLFKRLSEKKQNQLLPKEIITRKRKRISIIYVLAFFPLLASVFWFSLTFMGSLVISILIFLEVEEFIIEYLLCTTSLPPGERERRKAEREMKSANPQMSL